jgi:hypothetical protein
MTAIELLCFIENNLSEREGFYEYTHYNIRPDKKNNSEIVFFTNHYN